MQFQNSQIQSNGDLDIFSVTYNSAGVQQSIQHWGGTGPDIGWEILSSDNQWFICGSFSNTMQVGTDVLTSSGNTDFFIIGSDVSSQSADFAFSANNLTVDFTLTSASPDSLRWDFGDGTYSTLTNPQHTYPSYNSFEVTLTAYFPCNTDTASHTVVLCTLPVSAFTYEKDYLFVQFNNSTTFADSVLWQFGDGSVSTQNNPSHLYASAGNYNVNLISFNSCGNDTAVVSMVVCDQMVSDFEFTIQENLVLFTNLSSGFFNVLWDFGDGTTSTLLNPEHEYPASGDFVVQLYCYSPCDTMVSVDTVTVCLLPVPAFTYSFSGDMTYQFINQSTDYLTCMWYFGDGDSSSLQNPVHTYNSSMVFPVQLVLYNNCGTASITDSINLITDIFEITNDPVIVQTISNGNIMINIKEPDGIQDLFLYDLKGSLRYKTQIQTSVFINTNSYNSGLYILRIINNNKELFKRKICITH
jgi:PKD repeat protein